MSTPYVPCLRWKQGEILAIENLKNPTQDKIVPLCTIESYDYDPPVAGGDDPQLESQLERAGQRLGRARGARLSWIDLNDLDPASRCGGQHHVEYFFAVARTEGCLAVPVLCLASDAPFCAAVRSANTIDGRGYVLRLEVSDFDSPSFVTDIENTLAAVDATPSEVDLVVDLQSTPEGPIAIATRMVVAMIGMIPNLSDWRSLTLSSCAFPENLTGLAAGTHRVPRNDWDLWQRVRGLLPQELRFGDYTMRHPTLIQLDPRIINPSVSVRYTAPNEWIVVRGAGMRTPGGGGLGQFVGHARVIVSLPEYTGAAYSYGDAEIQRIATTGQNAGNMAAWVKISVNHHIELVVDQVSTLLPVP